MIIHSAADAIFPPFVIYIIQCLPLTPIRIFNITGWGGG